MAAPHLDLEGVDLEGVDLEGVDLEGVDLDGVVEVLRAHGIAFALVFGSQAEGRARKDSDVDLAVWSPRPVERWRLGAEMPPTVDLTVLSEAPEWLAGRVAMTGLVVLDDDPVARVRWQAQTRKQYLDEAPRRDAFRRTFIQAHG